MREKDPFLTVPSLERIRGLVHGFGTRSLTWKALRAHGSLQNLRPVMMRQIHSDVIHTVEAFPENDLEGDALITRFPGLLLCVRTADCLPVLIADPESGAVAAVHCGWRGTSLRLVSKVVQMMQGIYESRPVSLKVALGPSIGRSCYEVGRDVAEAFQEDGGVEKSFFSKKGQGKYFLDLKEANRQQLTAAGVLPQHIFSLDICTHCNPGFYSYRRDRDECGRLINFIGWCGPEKQA